MNYLLTNYKIIYYIKKKIKLSFDYVITFQFQSNQIETGEEEEEEDGEEACRISMMYSHWTLDKNKHHPSPDDVVFSLGRDTHKILRMKDQRKLVLVLKCVFF